MIKMSEAEKRLERSVGRFNTCDNAGRIISLEVDKLRGTKATLGWCAREGRRIDIDPSCRICLRHTKRKKKSTKKTATQINKIKQGRKRQQQRKEEGKKWRTKGSE